MLIRDRIKEFRRVRASELEPNPKNWRTHPKAQQEALQGALAEIGYADALIAYEPAEGRLRLVDGHLRAETTPDQEVPVLVLDVTEDEADKLLVTLDPMAGLAGMDEELLRTLAATVETESEGLRSMLDSLVPVLPEDGLTDPDAIPEPPDEPITKPGDLWVLGDHRLLCGDSTSADDVARLLDGGKPFIMVTDPPYGVNYDPQWRADAGVNKNTERMGAVANDDRVEWDAAYAEFPGVVSYVWHAPTFGPAVDANLRSCGFQVRSMIVWKKARFALSRGHYHWGHECALYGARGSSKWCGDRKQSTVWEIALAGGDGDNAKGLGHSTQKPVECMRRPIANHGGEGDDVYDPFVGSGTTIIAAEQLKRRCYAMEIDPTYCDVVVKRWEEFTGKKATRGE